MSKLWAKIVRSQWFWIAISMFSLTIRIVFYLIFLSNNQCLLSYDCAHYHGVAVSLAHGLGFVGADGAPYFYRVPGYPFFLSLCYRLFGYNPEIALWIQIVIGAIVPVLIGLLARLLFPGCKRVALFAALISCVYPGFLIFSGLIMSDLLFLVFWLLFLLCFCSTLMQKMSVYVGFSLAGIILGLAFLIRPIEPLFILIPVGIIICAGEAASLRIKRICCFVLSWGTVLAFWIVRNFLLTGYFFLHTLSGPHFINHFASNIVMAKEHCSYEQAGAQVRSRLEHMIADREYSIGRPLLEIERVKVAQKLSLSIAWDNKLITLKHTITNMLKTCFALYSSELLLVDSGGDLPPYSNERSLRAMIMRYLNPAVHNHAIVYVIWWEIFLYLLVLISCFAFVIVAIIRRNWIFLLSSTALLGVFFVGITLACGYARFRLPI